MGNSKYTSKKKKIEEISIEEVISILSQIKSQIPIRVYNATKAIQIAIDTLEKIPKIRTAFADYHSSEGCSCCRSSIHPKNEERMAILLDVPKYEDKSGYNFAEFETKPKNK